MKNNVLLTTVIAFLVLISLTNIFAQNRSCGSDAYWDHLKKHDKSVGLDLSSFKKNLRTGAANQILTIPVVVHVLYNTTTQNISDQQILSQIDALNKDYNKQNTDINLVPSTFTSIAANCEIQFCMAQRDPFGMSTTGITRTYTPKTSFSNTTDDAKYDAQGGKNAWDVTSYLNIWVVPSIQSNSSVILGYSSFPSSGVDPNDGVVIAHRYFGTMGTAVSSNMKGRTATHEIGHWLGLYHIFQDGCSGLSLTSCSYAGDLVCDTPPASSAAYGCPSTKNTCSETNDKIDMTMNYMDYVDDNCMYMFTTGQKERMWYHINTYRASLFESKGCMPLIQYDDNVSLKKIENLGYAEFCSNEFSPKVSLVNIGTNTITSIELQYGTAVENRKTLWTGTIQIGQSQVLDLDPVSLQNNANAFFVKVLLVNGKTDVDSTFNQLNTTISVLSSLNLPFSDDFENVTNFNSFWSIRNPDNRITWERSNLASVSGDYALFVNNTDYPAGNGEIDDIVSPPLYIQSNAQLTFKYAYKFYTELGTDTRDFSDTLRLFLDIDCSGNLQEIYDGHSVEFTTGTPYFTHDLFIPTADEWRTVTLDLSSFEGKNARLVLRNISDNENSLFVDDIQITDAPLSVNDEDIANIQVYPTKAASKVNIIVPQSYELEIYNSTGQLLDSEVIHKNSYEKDISSLQGNLFVFKIKTQNSTKTFKIVKE